MCGLFDTHAHYDDKRFDEKREDILSGLKSRTEVCPCGVEYVVNAGCTLESSLASVRLAEKYGFIYAACGIHPHEAQDAPADWEERLIGLLSHPKVRAIGEIGLDFHYDFSPRDVQERFFEKQLELSEKTGYPVIVHDRDAHGRTMDIISRRSAAGIMHSFSGSREMAKELVKRGWYVSYSGSVTFKNAVNLAATVECVPDDRLLLETDSPFLAPVPYRGNINCLQYTYAIAEKLAQIRSATVEDIIKLTNENAKRFFALEG